MFQQDNASAHTSWFVVDFLRDSEIQTLEWPSKSPDLNPIEHVWDYLGLKVQARSPQNLRDLEAILLREWNLIPQDFIDNLVGSMRRRLGAVIEPRGGSTKY